MQSPWTFILTKTQGICGWEIWTVCEDTQYIYTWDIYMGIRGVRYLLKKCHVEKRIISILGNQLRWTWNNHVCNFLIVLSPIIHIGSEKKLTNIIYQGTKAKFDETHFGTITSNVVKYSESRIKCSFFTRSAKLRVNKLPLKMYSKILSYLLTVKMKLNAYVCFFSKFWRLPLRLL